MDIKIIDIKDENTPVALSVYLTSGQTIWIRVIVKAARDFIQQWRKYLSYAGLTEEEQKKICLENPKEVPMWNYHFLEGIPGDIESNKNISTLVCFRNVTGAQYIEISDNNEKQEEYFNLLLKKLKSELKDDAWKDKE